MDSCIFCKIASKEIPGKYLYEDEVCVAFLDLSQATKGHTLVVPKKHVKNVLDVDAALSAHLFEVATKLAQHLCRCLDAKGCNLLTNANEVAGQTILHYHIHIIPRYEATDGVQFNFEDHTDVYDLDTLQDQLHM